MDSNSSRPFRISSNYAHQDRDYRFQRHQSREMSMREWDVPKPPRSVLSYWPFGAMIILLVIIVSI